MTAAAFNPTFSTRASDNAAHLLGVLLRVCLKAAPLVFVVAPVVVAVEVRHDAATDYRARVNARELAAAVLVYRADTGRYPDGLGVVVGEDAERLEDPWGHAYRFVVPGVHSPSTFDVASDGADGVAGTDDDFGNWAEE